MIDIKDKVDCCGCNACSDVCPEDAITFVTDNEGFWYPEVNMDRCIDCHLCEKVCPIINPSKRIEVFDEPVVVGAYNKDESIRMDSTSGGIHSIFAKKIYSEHGYVGGAIFNEDHTASQIISSDPSFLENIRSSKYLQSNAEGVYRKIKNLVLKGETVFFCGTPCQIQALYNFMGHKIYQNLITADFVCLGVNSPKVFLKYMNMLEQRYHSKATTIKFKNKKRGWHNFSLKVNFENGKEYCKDRSHDPYFVGYCTDHLFTRPSCYECRFRNYPHVSDLTLADFWGIDKLDITMDQDKGTSLLLINTIKGRDFFEQIKDDLVWKEYQWNDLHRIYATMFENSPLPNGDRKQFFNDLDKVDFNKIAHKCFSMPHRSQELLRKTKTLIKRIIKR